METLDSMESTATSGSSQADRVRTGIEGLDHILAGGLPRKRLYLVQGDPGVGKTTLALQYLMTGRENKESVLYITLSETEDELKAVAASHGWSLEGIHIRELSSMGKTKKEGYTLFHPSEVELTETTDELIQAVEQTQPARLVIDSLSELRLLARDPLVYRRQIFALKQYFAGRDCTVLILDDHTAQMHELQLQTLVHGVILLEQMAPEFGGDRRRMRISKMREVRFRSGYHDFTIEKEGLVVYPRLVAAEYRQSQTLGTASSGIAGLDSLLGGGLDRGTSTLLVGAAGAGKSALAMQFVMSAARRGEHSAVYTFDESLRTLLARAEGMGMSIKTQIKKRMIAVQQIDPAELSPGEFAFRVRQAVLRDQVRMVVIDSLNGYLNAMPEEKFLTIQMHELLTFLGIHGVVTILVVSQHGLIGSSMSSPVDVSYLADTVVLLRYYENAGQVHKAISVLKKRSGSHLHEIRELQIQKRGITVGPPLKDFHGILTGVPVYEERMRKNGTRNAPDQ